MLRPKYLSDSKRVVFGSVFCPGARGVNTAVEPTRGGEKDKKGVYMDQKIDSLGAKESGVNMRLSRKDKQALKRALWGQIDNILSNVEVKSGYGADLEHLPVEVIREYLEAVIYGRKGSI